MTTHAEAYANADAITEAYANAQPARCALCDSAQDLYLWRLRGRVCSQCWQRLNRIQQGECPTSWRRNWVRAALHFLAPDRVREVHALGCDALAQVDVNDYKRQARALSQQARRLRADALAAIDDGPSDYDDDPASDNWDAVERDHLVAENQLALACVERTLRAVAFVRRHCMLNPKDHS
jgi:hypothetical protein